MGSDTDFPGPDCQSLNDLEMVPGSDNASFNPVIPNNDDRSATEGPLEQVNAAETSNLDALHSGSSGGQSRYSLDVLVEHHRDSLMIANSDTAATVALPETIASTSSMQDHPNTLEDSSSVHQQIYLKEIQRLSRYMPHLRNVSKDSRVHHRAEVNCLDFNDGHLVSKKPHELESCTLKSEKDFIQSLIGDIPSEVDLRVLIVDDLSDTLIYLLGSGLSITPELFEEHLLNSGWHDHTYEDSEIDLWSTRNLTKNYASIRWYRPIQRRTARPYESEVSSDMHDPLTAPDSWMERLSPTMRISHSTEPLVNLLRRPWEASFEFGGISAWEERATVWATNVGSCHIILLLLDPLPTVRHCAKVIEEFAPARNRIQTRVHPERNELITESPRSQEPEDGGSSRGQVRQSIFSRIKRKVRSLGRVRITRAPGTEPRVQERPQNSLIQTVLEVDQPNQTYKDHYLFTSSLTRLPVLIYEDLLSTETDHRLNSGMGPEKSTACALEELVQSHRAQAIDSCATLAPLEYLLTIILHDTLTILRSIDLALTDMHASMLDDELLQLRIDFWRLVLNRFETELRHMETSVSEFARYIVGLEVAKGTRTCEKLLGQCVLQIAKVQERRRITYGSLMTAMSLVESKRGISEAESVTKLTELAFFFIPLTFAASLFSMQVKELDARTTSVGLFLGVALTITGCSYALRLIIRSSAFLSFWRRKKNEIRESTSSSSASPIATTTVLRWIWNGLISYTYSSYIYPMFAIIPTAALLAGLWMRSLQEGIKVGVTIALSMLLLAFILSLGLLRWDISKKWARRLAY